MTIAEIDEQVIVLIDDDVNYFTQLVSNLYSSNNVGVTK